MSRTSRVAVWVICVMALSAGLNSARADVPRLIHYQGKLKQAGGAVVTGPVGLRIRLYEQPTGGAALFDETHAGVPLNLGLFSLLIGSQTPGGVPDSALDRAAVYLGVSVDGAAELAPRILLTTAPYSAKSRSAEQLVRPGTFAPAASVDAAGRIAVGTGPADGSAALDVASTTGGFLPPRMTTAQRNAIANPAVGLVVFNTTSNCLEFFLGGQWQSVACGCTSAPSAPLSISGPATVCVGDTDVIYTIAPVPGSTSYTWMAPAGSTIVAGHGTTSISVNIGSTSGQVSVTADNVCGSSSPRTLAVTVSDVPPAPASISGPTEVCMGQTGVAYTAADVPGVTSFNWTVPSGATVASGQGSAFVTINFGSASGDVSVTVTNECGQSGPRVLAVAVQPVPSSSFTGPASGSINTPVGFSAAVPGVSYAWTFENGTPPSSAAESPSVTWSSVGTFTVSLTVTQFGCSSQATTRSIQIFPAGLQIWLDASAITGVNNGELVPTWSDLSGNSRHATQSSPGEQPTYVTNALNGMAVLYFPDRYYDVAGSFVGAQVYMVYRSANSTFSNYSTPLCVTNRSGQDRNFLFSSGGTDFYADQFPTAVWKNGSSLSSPFDMAPITSYMQITVNTFQPSTTRTYYVNRFDDNSDSDLYIAEVMAFNVALSTPERESVEQYLRDKWGL